MNPDTATGGGMFYVKPIEATAIPLSIKSLTLPVHSANDIEAAMATLAEQPGSAAIIVPDSFSLFHADLIVTLAARYHLPTVYNLSRFAKIGGLMSYGPNMVDVVLRSASYVDRILRGESPAELPVQAPTKYDLVINHKTAKTLGLEIPPTMLGLADEVIE